jgi:hypothetical protein
MYNKDPKKVLIKKFNYSNRELNFYKIPQATHNLFVVLDHVNEVYCSIFKINALKNFMELSGVWNHPEYMGLSTLLYKSFIKPSYPKLICDGGRSIAGKKWFDNQILIPALKDPGYKCYVLNIKTNEYFYPTTFEEFEQYYGKNIIKFVNYRIVIERL